jgi:tetratricopeptide (TPR) repeat protein
MGGVGKTALALHWAHSTAARFADGQVYVNLRGFDPRAPLTVTEAFHGLLTALGMDPADIPQDLDGRARRYRELLAGRRMLVLLDNAADAAQARPLLPPASCLTLVTSRDRLDDLTAGDGARSLPVAELADDEAIALLRDLIGERCEREPDATRRLTVLCGHLPLALRAAAQLISSRPSVGLDALVQELAETTSDSMLVALETGDLRSDTRAVLSWSLRWLPNGAAQTFRLLGLAPGDTVDAYVTAAVSGVEVADAARTLETLAQAHLLHRVRGDRGDRGDRYGMHDLLRSYAMELAEAELTAATRRTSLTALLDYYLAGATAAMHTAFRGKFFGPRSSPPHERPPILPNLSTVDVAMAWLTTERAALVSLGLNATQQGFPAHALALSRTLRLFLDNGHDQSAHAVHSAALAAAAQLGSAVDPLDRAAALVGVGLANMRMGRLDDAQTDLEKAFAEQMAAGSAPDTLASATALGTVRLMQGHLREALAWQHRGLEAARMTGVNVHEGIQLCNVGAVHVMLEEHEQAISLCQSGLDILAENAGPAAAVQGAATLAEALVGVGRYDEAIDLGDEALALARSIDHVEAEVEAAETVAGACRHLGRFAEATRRLDEALNLARQTGRGGLVAMVLNALGEVHHDGGAFSLALDCHREALDQASAAQDFLESARARLGLGDAHAGLGETAAAQEHWRRALELYTDLGLPAATRVRERLTPAR